MPPWPICERSVYAPTACPARDAGGVAASGRSLRKPARSSASCRRSRASRSSRQRRVLRAQRGQPRLALLRRQVQCAVQVRKDHAPAIRAKLDPHPPSRHGGRGGPSPSAAAPCAPTGRAWPRSRPNEKPQKNFRSTTWASTGSTRASASIASRDAGQARGLRPTDRRSRGQGRDLELAAALARLAVAHVVDDQRAHHPGGVGHEAAAVGKDGPSRRAMSR